MNRHISFPMLVARIAFTHHRRYVCVRLVAVLCKTAFFHYRAEETSRTIIRASSLTCYQASTAGLSTKWSAWDLGLDKRDGKSHLGGGFALRCIQRLSLRDVAIQLWGRPPNWLTSGHAISVLSYWRGLPAIFLRPRRIETELSRDVLNPARVPL